MRTRILARWAMALAVAVAPVSIVNGQSDAAARPADSDPPTAEGFPWLCFATSVAALGGLYVLVRRREQAIEVDRKLGRRPEPVWYCRACDRDVSGPECPHCRAANPFGLEPIEPIEPRARARAGRNGH